MPDTHSALHVDVGDRTTEDRFNRKPFADRLAQTIAQRDTTDSFVIGLYGAWGEGKTTVLDYMDEALTAEPEVVLVRFNPWLFSSDEALTKALIEAIAASVKLKLKDNIEGAKRFGQLALSYGGRLVKTIGGITGNSFAEKGGELAESFADGMNPQDQTLHQLKERIGDELKLVGKKVVVLVDDIDRLTRKEIQQVFKLIKVAADFPTVTYVLAFDPEMVAAAVATQYGSGNPDDGQRFLEKIVQLPLQLPHADRPSMTEYTFDRLWEVVEGAGITLTDSQTQRFVEVLSNDIMAAIRTPRQAKRYANALAFALPILRGETNPVDVLLVEALRVLYPKTFEKVRHQPEVFLDPQGTRLMGATRDEQKAYWKNFLEGHDEHAISIIGDLFPEAGSLITGVIVSRAGDDPRRQGVHQARYFNRYFQYAISGDDVPDAEIAKFLDDLTADPAEAEALLQRIGPERNAFKFLEGIRDLLFTSSTRTQHAALLALARAVPAFDRETSRGRFANSVDAIVRLMRDLLEQSTKEEAESLGLALVNELPLRTAMRFMDFLQPGRRSRTLSVEYDQHQVEIYAALQDRLVNRLTEMGDDLQSRLGDDYYRGLKWLGRKDAEAAEANLTRYLDSGRNAVVEFLAARSPTSGKAYVPFYYSKDSYAALKATISVERLLPYLDTHFPETPTEEATGPGDVRSSALAEDEDVATTHSEVAAKHIATRIREFYRSDQLPPEETDEVIPDQAT